MIPSLHRDGIRDPREQLCMLGVGTIRSGRYVIEKAGSECRTFEWRVEVPLCLLGIVQGKASRCVGKSSLSVMCGQVLVCIHNPRNVHERVGRRKREEGGFVCVCALLRNCHSTSFPSSLLFIFFFSLYIYPLVYPCLTCRYLSNLYQPLSTTTAPLSSTIQLHRPKGPLQALIPFTSKNDSLAPVCDLSGSSTRGKERITPAGYS